LIQLPVKFLTQTNSIVNVLTCLRFSLVN
jgi:hypothetical protein